MDRLVNWRADHVFIECKGDDVYLTNQWGEVRPLEDVEEISRLLLETARRREKDIIIHNLENALYYERLFSKRYQKKEKPNPQPRYVYMFKCGENKYKIGVSMDVERRRKELDNRPYSVTIYAVSKVPFSRAFEVEADLHKLHENNRVDGEWFEIDQARAELTAILIENADDDYENGE